MNEERKLNIAKIAMKRKVQEEAKAKLNALTQEYSQWEAMAWSKMEEEAKQYQIDGTVGPYMTEEVGMKYDAASLSVLILAKAEALRKARAAIILERQQKEMGIDAAVSIDALLT